MAAGQDLDSPAAYAACLAASTADPTKTGICTDRPALLLTWLASVHPQLLPK